MLQTDPIGAVCCNLWAVFVSHVKQNNKTSGFEACGLELFYCIEMYIYPKS